MRNTNFPFHYFFFKVVTNNITFSVSIYISSFAVRQQLVAVLVCKIRIVSQRSTKACELVKKVHVIKREKEKNNNNTILTVKCRVKRWKLRIKKQENLIMFKFFSRILKVFQSQVLCTISKAVYPIYAEG